MPPEAAVLASIDALCMKHMTPDPAAPGWRVCDHTCVHPPSSRSVVCTRTGPIEFHENPGLGCVLRTFSFRCGPNKKCKSSGYEGGQASIPIDKDEDPCCTDCADGTEKNYEKN